LEVGNNDKKSMILIVDDYYGVLPTFREAFEDFPQLELDAFTDPIEI
jgi:hypothetical protein